MIKSGRYNPDIHNKPLPKPGKLKLIHNSGVIFHCHSENDRG